MREIKILIILGVIFLLTLYGCGKKPDKGDKVIVQISNRAITLKDFNSRISKMPPYYRNIIEKNKRRYLDDMIMENVFYEEAARKGLANDKEVKDLLNEAKRKILITKFIKNEVESNVKVSEEEMRNFYEEHQDDFKTPELWRASHILVANEKEANDLLAEITGGASFEELARKHSIDATSSRGGDIGFFRQGQLVPDFEKACLKLEVGKVSEVVHTQFGYHIIKLTDKKMPYPESYEKVRRSIELELKRKKQGELFDHLLDQLKGKYSVHINEEALKDIENKEKDSSETAGGNI